MPRLHIDLKKIENNARLISELIEPFGLRLVVVTKACRGDGKVAGAMLAGACTAGHGIADSRLENIKRVRRHLPGLSGEDVELLRPPLAAGRLVPNLVYYITSAGQAEALLAKRPYKYYQMSLCLQVDTGDGREGVPAGQAAAEARKIAELEGAHFMGIATNLACATPSAPLKEALLLFSRTVEEVRSSIARARPPVYSSDAAIRAEQEHTKFVPFPPSLSLVSAGGSGLLKLLLELSADEAAALFEPLTELRCGEAILLGRVPSGEGPELFLPGTHRDAFVLEAPVLEVFEKKGRKQALIGLGIQDAGAAPLYSCREGITAVSATSDYLVVILDEDGDKSAAVTAGGSLKFIPSYYSLAAAMASPYVEKKYTGAALGVAGRTLGR